MEDREWKEIGTVEDGGPLSWIPIEGDYVPPTRASRASMSFDLGITPDEFVKRLTDGRSQPVLPLPRESEPADRGPEPTTGGVEWWRWQLARFTYKPGWKMRVEPLHRLDPAKHGVGVLIITVRVEDTYRPGVMVDVESVRALYPGTHDQDADHFAMLVAAWLKDVEIHESREWLRRDGEVFDDPHAKVGEK